MQAGCNTVRHHFQISVCGIREQYARKVEDTPENHEGKMPRTIRSHFGSSVCVTYFAYFPTVRQHGAGMEQPPKNDKRLSVSKLAGFSRPTSTSFDQGWHPSGIQSIVVYATAADVRPQGLEVLSCRGMKPGHTAPDFFKILPAADFQKKHSPPKICARRAARRPPRSARKEKLWLAFTSKPFILGGSQVGLLGCF